MTQPAYHLRPNKAVDRFVFIEAIRRLGRIVRLSDYTYYGFGGPYLEDFRLLYETFQEIEMVSIEGDPEVCKRQEFHRPFRALQIRNTNSEEFISEYEPGDNKGVVWLDYTNLSIKNFEEFQSLVAKVTEESVVKITLRAHPPDFSGKSEEFTEKFYDYLPDTVIELPRRMEMLDYADLIQGMVQITSENALRGQPHVFQPLSSFCYSDGTGMLTVTGIVWPREDVRNIRDVFEDWEFANLDWDPPKRIEVPFLSTKERLHLQSELPCDEESAGEELHSALGYRLGKDDEDTQNQLRSYSLFHRQYPYFIRAVP